MKLRVMAGTVMIAALCACGSSSGTGNVSPDALGAKVLTTAPSPAPAISGHIVLTDTPTDGLDSNVTNSNGSCFGTGGYQDLSAGTQVTLTDEANDVIGSTSLDDGVPGDSIYSCQFNFTFSTVAKKANFYSVEVGGRGKITNSASELAGNGWVFDLTLGS